MSTATLGRRIRDARKASRMTQHEVARTAGHTVAWLSDIERGRNGIGVFDLMSIAKATGRDVNWFLSN